MNLSRAVRRWPSREPRAWAEKFVAKACAGEAVVSVIAFGSAARDVTYSFDRAPIDVDVRPSPAHSISALIGGAHDLLGWSIRFGALVCERKSFWTRLVSEWRDRLPLPSREIALERAAKAEELAEDLQKVAEQHLSMLTHLARASLVRGQVYPASRPELPGQLREIRATALGDNRFWRPETWECREVIQPELATHSPLA